MNYYNSETVSAPKLLNLSSQIAFFSTSSLITKKIVIQTVIYIYIPIH